MPSVSWDAQDTDALSASNAARIRSMTLGFAFLTRISRDRPGSAHLSKRRRRYTACQCPTVGQLGNAAGSAPLAQHEIAAHGCIQAVHRRLLASRCRASHSANPYPPVLGQELVVPLNHPLASNLRLHRWRGCSHWADDQRGQRGREFARLIVTGKRSNPSPGTSAPRCREPLRRRRSGHGGGSTDEHGHGTPIPSAASLDVRLRWLAHQRPPARLASVRPSRFEEFLARYSPNPLAISTAICHYWSRKENAPNSFNSAHSL